MNQLVQTQILTRYAPNSVCHPVVCAKKDLLKTKLMENVSKERTVQVIFLIVFVLFITILNWVGYSRARGQVKTTTWVDLKVKLRLPRLVRGWTSVHYMPRLPWDQQLNVLSYLAFFCITPRHKIIIKYVFQWTVDAKVIWTPHTAIVRVFVRLHVLIGTMTKLHPAQPCVLHQDVYAIRDSFSLKRMEYALTLLTAQVI